MEIITKRCIQYSQLFLALVEQTCITIIVLSRAIQSQRNQQIYDQSIFIVRSQSSVFLFQIALSKVIRLQIIQQHPFRKTNQYSEFLIIYKQFSKIFFIKAINRNRTQSNITISKQVKITNQSISRIKLESIKIDSNNDTSYQNEEKSKQKVIAASRSGQFTRKVNLNNQVYIKKVYQGNYFFDKIKEILTSGLKDNSPLKKMSRDALNQIHMIMTYQELIPEVSLLYYGKSQKQVKIVFDLDETLVHSEEVQKDKVYDFKNNEFGLFIRPYCYQVLKELSQLADLFVYTSANQKYAKTIINLIDPENTFFKGHFYRNNCVSLQSKMQIKHLGILSNNYSKIVIIDNSPIFYMGQPYNGIPITPFIDDPQDNELLKLLNFLNEKILQSDDVRVTIRRFFQYDMFRQFSDGITAFNILYN